MRYALILLALVGLVAADGPEGQPQQPFQRGIDLYDQGLYAEAAEAFARAEEIDPADLLAAYNRLTSLAAGGDIETALRKLEGDFAALETEPGVRSQAAYNLGTALLRIADEADKNQQLAQRAPELMSSIRWLRSALLDEHADPQAKNNLEYANKLLEKLKQEQQEQQQQDGEGEQNEDRQQQDQDQQQGENQQDQQGQQNQQDQQQQQQQDRNEGEQEDQQSEQQQGQDQQQQQRQQQQQGQGEQQDKEQQGEVKQIPEDVARNLLKAAREAELKALKMLREAKNKDAKKKKGVRDW